jgi:hypothetical protein
MPFIAASIYLSPLLEAFDAMTAQEVQRNFTDGIQGSRRGPGAADWSATSPLRVGS